MALVHLSLLLVQLFKIQHWNGANEMLIIGLSCRGWHFLP